MYNLYFTVKPHVWVRTRAWFPPIVEDERELKKFAKCLTSESKQLSVIPAGLVDDAVSSFVGCLMLYKELFSANKNVTDELKKMKDDNTTNLIYALDLKDVQSFSYDSLERFELLQAIARGEKITPQSNHAAEYLLSKHGDTSVPRNSPKRPALLRRTHDKGFIETN